MAIFDFNAWARPLNDRLWNEGEEFPILPRIVCADGFSMSVQCHRGAYCQPRINYQPHYSSVEVGYPSVREETLMPYIDGGEDTDPTDTVYGYVPVEIIDAIVNSHGGLSEASS